MNENTNQKFQQQLQQQQIPVKIQLKDIKSQLNSKLLIKCTLNNIYNRCVTYPAKLLTPAIAWKIHEIQMNSNGNKIQKKDTR